MKRSTPEHFKVTRLTDALGCSRPEVIGLLELLWHFTAKSAPQGDVGRCTNREIAFGLYTSRDPDDVVSALVSAGWLDEDADHRLLVHDWQDHADEGVKKLLERRGLPFLSKHRDVSRKKDDASSPRRKMRRDPARGTGTGSGKALAAGSGSSNGADFEMWWVVYANKAAKKAARKAWDALKPTAYQAAVLMAAVERQQLHERELRFVPQGGTWLNGERWNDPPSGQRMPITRSPSVSGVSPPRIKTAAEVHREQDAEVARKREEFEQTAGPTILRDILSKAVVTA